MSVAKNFYNPIPFHDSTNKWYDCKRTFNGAHSHIYVPHNETLPFQLTIGQNDITAPSKACMITTDNHIAAVYEGSYTGGIAPVRGNNTYGLSYGNYFILMEDRGDGFALTYYTNGNSSYYGILTDQDFGATAAPSVLKGYTMPISSLTASTTKVFYLYEKQPDGAFVQTWPKVCELNIESNMMYVAVSQNVKIVELNSGTETDISSSFNVYPTIVPNEFRNSSKYYSLFFDTADLTLQHLPIGTYYLQVTINSIKYYSEPFEWIDDASELVYIRYRRTKPIVDSRNYIDFKSNGAEKYFKMYVQSEVMMPEFTDEEESVQNDGYTFIEKIVSYKTHKFTFPSTEYMADAIRLVRHCNDILISQGGDVYDVDYFAAPKIDWGDSNHFCIVECGFNTDTIIQTNGESADYIRGNSHGSFDDSFDSSFN